MRRRQLLAMTATGAALGGLSACGFHLRGNTHFDFAFRSIAVQAHTASTAGTTNTANTATTDLLCQHLATKVQVYRDPASAHLADALLVIHADHATQSSIALATAGSVRVVQLQHQLVFSLLDPQGQALIARASVQVKRDMSYSENEATAKQLEFDAMREIMRNDVVLQVLHRLAAVRSLQASQGY